MRFAVAKSVCVVASIVVPVVFVVPASAAACMQVCAGLRPAQVTS
jgi:hypothetical protein